MIRIRYLSISAILSLVVHAGCSADSVDTAIENSHQLNSATLVTTAAQALRQGQLEDAGFLFYAGRARFQIDKQVFPPLETGGNSPGVLMGAMTATVGSAIRSKLASDPSAFAGVIARLSQWTPKFDDAYDPGWKYQNRLPAKDASAAAATELKRLIVPLQTKSKLLENEEYRRYAKQLDIAQQESRRVSAKLNSLKPPSPWPDDLREEFRVANEAKEAALAGMWDIEWRLAPESRWHRRMGWDAAKYFDDAQVISLCHAIEDDNVEEMERLIVAGANVNSVGKNGMTPLLWAFPDHKLARFTCLLEHGANPNVIIEDDFGAVHTPLQSIPMSGKLFDFDGCHAGSSVMHLAAASPWLEYLRTVLNHGGDPNLLDHKTGEAPIDAILKATMPDMKERLELLVAAHADLNRYCDYTASFPAMKAVQLRRYEIALYLLESGADPSLYQPDGIRKLIHYLAMQERRDASFSQSSEQKAKRDALIEWLEQHGESLEDARNDEKKWAAEFKQALTPKAHAAIRERIVRERKQKEAAAGGGATGP